MRILSLSTCPLHPWLGSGKTRLRWSSGLRKLGHTVDIFEPKHYEMWPGLRRGIGLRQSWGACEFVKARLGEIEYDMVEFFGGEFGIITRQLARMKNRPLIVAHTDGVELLAHERARAYDPPDGFRKQLRSWFSALTHERISKAAFVDADAFVAGCELDRQYVLKLGLFSPDHAAVVSPGLDKEFLTMRFSGEKSERVAYTGSWIPRKGVSVVSTVMSSVLGKRPALHFDIFGTGVKRENILLHFAPELHSRISVYSRISNEEMADRLCQSKVFLFPTQYEGFGMALAEAMACSCAVVTTATGFGAELIDGAEAIVCGFNDVKQMEESVISLLDNEQLRLRIARAGWHRVQTLNWDANIYKLEQIYSRWISEFQNKKPERLERSL